MSGLDSAGLWLSKTLPNLDIPSIASVSPNFTLCFSDTNKIAYVYNMRLAIFRSYQSAFKYSTYNSKFSLGPSFLMYKSIREKFVTLFCQKKLQNSWSVEKCISYLHNNYIERHYLLYFCVQYFMSTLCQIKCPCYNIKKPYSIKI